jgi:hypothetical protein
LSPRKVSYLFRNTPNNKNELELFAVWDSHSFTGTIIHTTGLPQLEEAQGRDFNWTAIKRLIQI